MSMGKIMVADDDSNICELLRLYLEKEGFTVTLAHDGEAAVEQFFADTPDLVLLDIMMPKLDGWQVCREIRKKSNTPIIMLTAKGETFDKVLGLELGADDYITKPFSMRELMARVKANIRRTAMSQSGPAEGAAGPEGGGMRLSQESLSAFQRQSRQVIGGGCLTCWAQYNNHP